MNSRLQGVVDGLNEQLDMATKMVVEEGMPLMMAEIAITFYAQGVLSALTEAEADIVFNQLEVDSLIRQIFGKG